MSEERSIPLDYRGPSEPESPPPPPPQGAPPPWRWSMLAIGLIAGLGVGALGSYLAYSLAFAVWAAMLVLILGVKVGVGIGLTSKRSAGARGFGIGLLLSIGLGILIFSSICGRHFKAFPPP